MLAALFTLLFSNLSFAVDVDPCASWPVTLEEDADGFYEIGSADALYKFACMVNNGATNISGKLTADICMNACKEGESVLKANGTLSDNASNFTQWTPIGTSEKPYTGTFDGNGYTIRGLYFNDESTEYVGLFGYIDESAKVQNVGVVDSYFKGCQYVGGVVGYNFNGTVSNSYNTGSVSGETFVGGVVGKNEGSVSNVYNTGSVSESGNDVGGVVGNNFGTVSNAYNTGSVSGSGDDVGGVVGYSFNGTVSNVYNTGSVSGNGVGVGGVVGNNYGTVSNVYNTGAVSGETFVGGVVGNNGGTVSNAYYNTDMPCENCDSPIEGTTGKTTAELAALDVALAFENSDGVWVAGYDSISNGWRKYAFLSLKGVGTAPTFIELDLNATEVEISNVEELLKFAELVNAGNTTLNAKLTADIVVNEGVLKADGTLNGDGSNFTQWTPIGTVEKPYEGTFDGNGKRISGLYFSDEDVNYVGLFKYNEGIVQNVGVVDSYIRGRYYVGGVVGCNKGTVSNVYNTGAVSGSDEVGGVVGCNKRTISNVYNTGAVSGWVEVGGVVGFNAGNSTVSNVYNTGAVSGNVKVGGVVGWNIDGTVSNVYNTGAVSGLDEVGGVVGNNGGTVENAYYNTDFYAGNALGENKSGSIENVDGITTAELIAIDIGPDWVAGNLAYDKTTGKLAFGFPYLKNFGNSQYKITALEFKVVDNVIQIANADDLKDFARLVSEFGVTDVNAKLTADICLNACGEGESVLKADGTLNDADTSKFVKWTPIGTKDNPYIGTFDGQGHTVSGLYFNDDQMHYVGFFGFVGSGDETKGVVKNVGVVNSYIKGYVEIGGVVGYNQGTVSNSYNASAVNGKNQYVGGVVGYNDKGTVSNSYNTGAVSGNSHVVGGVVGYNLSGTVSNSYNAGPVYCGGQYFGGVVGFNMKGKVEKAYYNEDVFKSDAIGGADETAIATNVGGKTSAELAAGTDVVLDADFWVVGAVSENVKQDTLYYPYLKVFGPHKYVLGDVKKYAITVAVNDKAMGSVTGAGEYEYGTKVEISATAKKGYKFVKWSDGVKDVKRTITVTKAEKLTATFEKDSKKDAVVAMAQLPQFSVTASGKMVSIAGARPNSIVNVFDMQGNMVKTVVATSANFTFALPSAGVYIVKNGYTAKRVNVR